VKSVNPTIRPNQDEKGEIMQIITGAENITEFNLKHYGTTRMKMDACFDSVFPSIIASSERIKNGLTELADRGIRVRLVTEIRKENVIYRCKRKFWHN
jgi:hypothetical protein